MNEELNNKTSRLAFIASFVLVGVYLLSEPVFIFSYSLIQLKNTKEFNQISIISENGTTLCETILWVFALTFVAKNNTGILDKTIEVIKTIKTISTNALNTIKNKGAKK